MRIATTKQLKEEYLNSGYIYIAQCDDFPNIFKVGYTTSINKRINSLKIEYSTNNDFKFVNYYKSANAKNLEKIIHKKLKEFLFEMKKFKSGGNTKEFFNCNLEYINEVILKSIEEDNNRKNKIENRIKIIWEQNNELDAQFAPTSSSPNELIGQKPTCKYLPTCSNYSQNSV